MTESIEHLKNHPNLPQHIGIIMDSGSSLKAIKQLIGQTPLIINPDRDADSFQSALAAVPTEKL